MNKLLPSFAIAASVMTMGAISSADPATNMSSVIAGPRMCPAGQQVACSCGGGSQGAATCRPNGRGFSACACANVSVTVPQPVVRAEVDVRGPDVRVGAPNVVVLVPAPPPRVVRRRRPPSKPSSGLGLLIGGASTLGSGAITLAFGIDRIRDYGKDPLGIVATSLGGTAMLVGLPLTIVGIVKYSSFRSAQAEAEAERQKKEDTKKETSIRFVPTANGFALHF